MFEGKHIHFSPADNKPLCSYSNKLCRQRRLNGYAFCIRHILEDKSAPFKRCTYVTRNNNQICQNAIPTSHVSRGYCHSHMQVAGIIPKTERKVKNPPPPTKPVDSLSGSIQSIDSNSNSSNSNNSSNSSTGGGGVKKDPNAVFKFEDEEHSEIQWIPKGGRINGIVNGSGKVNDSTTTLKGKDLQVLSATSKDTNGGTVLNGRIHNGNLTSDGGNHLNPPVKKVERKNGKLPTLTNGFGLSEKDKDSLKSRETYGKKVSICAKGKKEVIIETGISLPSPTAVNPPSNKGKQLSSSRSTQECESSLEKTTVEKESPHCIPEHGKFFDQFKTLKCVEKSVLLSKKGDFCPVNNNKPTNSQTKLRTIPTIPKLEHSSNQRSSQQQQQNIKIIKNSTSTLNNIESCISNSRSTYVDLFNSVSCAQKGSNSLPPFSLSNNIITVKRKYRNGQEESRQEFLARVRDTFKSQYLTIKHTSNHSDKNEKIWKRALRNSLLTCVLKDVSYCAHVIVQNDPNKYSDPDIYEEVTNGKNSPAITFKPKKPNTTTPITAVVNINNNGKSKQGKKNGLMIDTELVSSKYSEGISSSIKIGTTLNNVDSKGKSKGSKRNPATDLDINTSPAQSKKKARKISDLNSTSLIINGFDGSISGSESSTSSQSSTSVRGTSSQLIRRSTSAKKSASESSPDGIEKLNAHKKRKFDLLNGSEHSLGPPSPFRVPKVEDSSHLSNDIDIKMENGGHGQMVFNNYNGHISSHSHHRHHHHPLLHPHSGSATTATANNKASNLSNAHQVQLQHLLSQPDLRSLATTSGNCKNGRNQGINTVLNSVGPSELGGNSDNGVITDASFDSTFEHSVSSQQDCDFSDDDLLIDPENDDLEKSLEFQIDPETEHQASRLLEDNELTEDDLNELFPETSNKIGRSADLSDLGVDFSSAFDANDIDYSLFANIFPFASRSNQSESISISNQY